MTKAIVRLWSLILFYFGKRDEPAPAPIEPITPPSPDPASIAPPRAEPITVAKPLSNRRSAKAVMRLKATILDQLEDNTKIFGRMKDHFPMEYGVYSKVGAMVVPPEEFYENNDYCDDLLTDPVSPWFKEARPGFGAIVTGKPHDENAGKGHPVHPRLIHFLKVKEPKQLRKHFFPRRGGAEVQSIAKGSDLYEFVLYFDERDWARLFPKKTKDDRSLCKFYSDAFAFELPIEITKDGEMRPLKIMRDRHLKLRQGYYADVRRTVREWDYPYSKEWVKACKSKLTPEQYTLLEASWALRRYEHGSGQIIQVRAIKNGIATLININVEETPDFFNDREDVIEDGIKKRIFHIVRAHARIGSRGVRVHFRGLRKFNWNGYAIEISVPGREHFDFKDWDLTAYDENDPRVKKGMPMDELAAWMVDNQRIGFGKMVGKAVQALPLKDFREGPRP